MPSTNEQLSDRTIRHATYLSRVATHQANVLKEELQGWQDDIEKILIPLVVELVRENSGLLTLSQQNKLMQLRLRISDMNERLTGEVYDRMKARLQDIIDNEADFVTRLYRELTNHDINDPETIDDIGALTIGGKTLRDMLQTLGQNTTKKLHDTVKQGLLDEKGTDAILEDEDEVWAGRMAVAAAIAETGVYMSSARARDALFDANGDIIRGYFWSAILDSKLCIRCAARYDANPYPPDERPFVPEHLRCRCVVYSLVEGGGEIPDLDFDEWLERQPKSVQIEILGKRKRELWKQGTFEVDEFVAGDKILTLDELRALEGDIQG